MRCRCLAPTLTWYSGWNRLEGYDICNFSEGEWKWLADWSLLHKCNAWRSEEHTSELQSLMRNSYAVFCLKKKTDTKRTAVYRKSKLLNHTELLEARLPD